jgi:twin BRCT domain
VNSGSPAFFSPDEGKLFSGVHATTSGITSPDLEKIIGSIQALGGQYSSNYTRSTTHLITISTTTTKYIAAMGHRAETGIKVVVPHWVNDCMNAHRRLPEEPYEYPEPVCLSGDQITKSSFELDYERVLLFQSLNSNILKDAQPPTIEQPSDPQVLRGRKIYLSPSLNLDQNIRISIEAGIKANNGQLVDSIENAGVLITRYREGADYITAHNKGITIGTLEWLRHVERTGVFYSPTDQLLHYPIPSIPIPGFSKHVRASMSWEVPLITNLTGSNNHQLHWGCSRVSKKTDKLNGGQIYRNAFGQ